MSSTRFAFLSGFLVAGAAMAQLADVPPFTGAFAEEFETPGSGACVPGRVFDNHGSLCASTGGSVWVVHGGWLLYVGYIVYPRNGSNAFFGSTMGYAVLTFDAPVQRFGAWFATVGYLAGGTARLYDAAGSLITTRPITAPRGGPWAWNGWDAGAQGPKIKRIELLANDPYNGGALICIDDAQVDVWLGTIATRPTGCGGLAISVTGIPVTGDTLTFTLGGATGFSGFVVGAPTSGPIGPCPGCTLGVNGTTASGSPYVLDIPNDPIFLDMQFAVQGFTFGTGPCLGTLKISDTIDVRVGA